MNAMQIAILAKMSKLTVEFEVNGRTFQIPSFGGMYERFFHANSHPTHNNVSAGKMDEMLAKATSFVVYKTFKDDGEEVKPENLENYLKENNQVLKAMENAAK